MNKKNAAYLIVIGILTLVLVISICWVVFRANKIYPEWFSSHGIKGKTEKVSEIESKSVFHRKKSPVEQSLVPEVNLEKKENNFNISDIKAIDYVPSEKVRSAICEYISDWTGESNFYTKDSAFFNEISVFPVWYMDNVMVDVSNPVIFAFTPEYQGICSFGFCDSALNWIPKAAFISVFSEKGDLLMCSLDVSISRFYYETQLSNQEIYYIVVGKNFQNESDFDLLFRIQQNIKGRF